MTADEGVTRSAFRTVAAIVSAGTVIGSIAVVFTLSFAAIIYSGPLAAHLSQGIGLTLIGSMIMGAVGALTMSYRGTICQPQDVTAILLALAAATIVGTGRLDPDAAFATVAALVALSTIATGVVAYGMGRLRLGYLVRYVPLPVICGFLAATGVLLIIGAFQMAVPDLPAPGEGLLVRLAEAWPRWLPWCALAAIIAVLVRMTPNGFVVPMALLAATVCFYAFPPLFALDLDGAREAGLLIGPFQTQSFFGALDIGLFGRIDWTALLSQIPIVLAVIGMSIVGTLLNASGLELAIKREVDLDRDLRGVGVANMTAGLGGGMVGYHLLGETLLARRIGIAGMAAGFSVAAVSALAFFFGAEMLSALPLGLFAAVIWFLGFDIVLTAVRERGWHMPWREFALVVVTPVIALAFGFLAAVGFGVLAACLLFILAYASVDVVRLSTTGARFRARIERSPADYQRLGELGAYVHIYRLSGFLFFGSARQLVERIGQERGGEAPPRIVVVDLRKVVGLDMSAMAAFERLVGRFGAKDVRFIVTGLSAPLVERFGDWMGSHGRKLEILGDLDDVLGGIEEQLLAQHAAERTADDRSSLWTGGTGQNLCATLEKYGNRMTFAPGDLVLAEGAPADHLMVLLTGRLKVSVADGKGGAVTVNRLLPGAILGEIGYYANVPRTACVEAETAATAFQIDAEALSRMERESPSQAVAFHRNLAGTLARRLINSTQLLKDTEV